LTKITDNNRYGTMAEWLRREIRITDISYGFRAQVQILLVSFFVLAAFFLGMPEKLNGVQASGLRYVQRRGYHARRHKPASVHNGMVALYLVPAPDTHGQSVILLARSSAKWVCNLILDRKPTFAACSEHCTENVNEVLSMLSRILICEQDPRPEM
jgi:hypothetical protein